LILAMGMFLRWARFCRKSGGAQGPREREPEGYSARRAGEQTAPKPVNGLFRSVR
jgi:hypothetical protein